MSTRRTLITGAGAALIAGGAPETFARCLHAENARWGDAVPRPASSSSESLNTALRALRARSTGGQLGCPPSKTARRKAQRSLLCELDPASPGLLAQPLKNCHQPGSITLSMT